MKKLSSQQFFTSLTAAAREKRTPESVLIELTYGCNLRCVHCYNPTHRAVPQELTREEWTSVLTQISEMGVVALHISGGEPFSRPDAEEIFGHAARLGFLLNLLTNATFITEPVADRLRRLDLESVTVSIYGASEAVYERVTRIPGSYERFCQGLACLAARGLPVTVRMPVMTANAEEVRDARSLVEAYGFKFQYSLDIIPRVNGDPTPLRYRLDPQDKIRIDTMMFGQQETSSPETSCRDDGSFISCSCGRSRFAITPYGEMNLCAAFPIPKYDLRRGTVKEGWEVLKSIVDNFKPNEHDECPSCNLRSHCRQGRSDAWLETGDMSLCLPHYKELAILEKSVHESNPRHLD